MQVKGAGDEGVEEVHDDVVLPESWGCKSTNIKVLK